MHLFSCSPDIFFLQGILTRTIAGMFSNWTIGPKQDQVHLASRTHFVDLVIHDIWSKKIYIIFCGPSNQQYLFQKDYAIFFWQIIDINKKFCTVSINFLLQLFKSFSFLGENFFGGNFFGWKFFGWKFVGRNFFGCKFWV